MLNFFNDIVIFIYVRKIQTFYQSIYMLIDHQYEQRNIAANQL